MLLSALVSLHVAQADGDCPQELNHNFRKLHSSEEFSLCQVASAPVLLIVNTASHCGFTPQFQDLEKLHQTYGENGLVIIGFPSNDFNQAAQSEAEAAKICYVNNGVSFTMASPIAVKSQNAHPLFRYLADETQPPSWNFNKYLVNTRTGEVLHFGSQVQPQDAAITDKIEALL